MSGLSSKSELKYPRCSFHVVVDDDDDVLELIASMRGRFLRCGLCVNLSRAEGYSVFVSGRSLMLVGSVGSVPRVILMHVRLSIWFLTTRYELGS